MPGKKKLRITVLGPVCPFKGGISHYNTELCNHLAQKAQTQIISYSRAFPDWLYPGKTQKDVRSKNFFRGHAEFIFDTLNPFSWAKTAKTIAQFKPDVLIFHWHMSYFSIPFYTLFRMLRKKHPCRIVAICHEVLPHEKTVFDPLLIKLIFNEIDLFVVHSQDDYQRVKHIVPQASVKKLFHPIYDLFYKKISKTAARKRLNITDKAVLFFGFVRPYKGLDYLLDALPAVLKKIPVTLYIVGEFFEKKQKYMNKIEQLGIKNHVKIIDHYVPNEDVPFYFSAADLVVTPYVSASQSGVINIAYAFDKPVIATDVGGLGDIVKNNKTGYLVKPRNGEQIARAIIAFYRDGAPDRFKDNIALMKKELSWEHLCEKIIQEIK